MELAFQWALEQGCAVAAMEVSLPGLGAPLDAAGCVVPPPRKGRKGAHLRVGDSMIFECISTRGVLLRVVPDDAAARARLEALHKERTALEESMRREFPTLREGHALFPEYDAYRYRDVGDAAYNALSEELEALATRVCSNSKLARLLRGPRANLQYLVAERGVVAPAEVPVGWGLLERSGGGVAVIQPAEWREVSEADNLALFHRIVLGVTANLRQRMARLF